MATVGPPIASSAITTPAKTLGAAECPLPIGDTSESAPTARWHGSARDAIGRTLVPACSVCASGTTSTLVVARCASILYLDQVEQGLLKQFAPSTPVQPPVTYAAQALTQPPVQYATQAPVTAPSAFYASGSAAGAVPAVCTRPAASAVRATGARPASSAVCTTSSVSLPAFADFAAAFVVFAADTGGGGCREPASSGLPAAEWTVSSTLSSNNSTGVK
ncbi:hypothetical protein PC123_g17536 [Phytophthora cactorum]|nr:hypothetical protein PC123_g17536 [Phytophthora cactorum]